MKKRILLPLVTYPDPNEDTVATAAVATARLLGAEIHAVAVTVDIPDVTNALSRMVIDLKGMEHAAEKSSRDNGERLLAAVEKAAAAAGVGATTDSVAAAPELAGDTAAAHARYFDATIIGWEGKAHPSASIAETVIFGSGRPVLLLPRGMAPASLDHIAIAWDGSRSAARALADAAPLLGKAKAISVLVVEDEKPHAAESATRLAGELEQRGLPARLTTIKAEDRPIDTTLQDRAREAGADLLVMGAFGHSRLRDFVLGGATKGVLIDLRLPVMLSH